MASYSHLMVKIDEDKYVDLSRFYHLYINKEPRTDIHDDTEWMILGKMYGTDIRFCIAKFQDENKANETLSRFRNILDAHLVLDLTKEG